MEQKKRPVSPDLNENLEVVKKAFCAGVNADIIIREFTTAGGVRCFLAYLDGMANTFGINDYIIRPMLQSTAPVGQFNKSNIIQYNNVESEPDIDKAVTAVLQGDTPVFVEGDSDCAVCETKGFVSRSVSHPVNEAVVKGSHEAFNENIRTNITLLRRILKTPKLCTEFIGVGGISGEKCAVMYIDGLTSPALVGEVKSRLQNIKGDFISGAGMVEQLIEDSRFSLFPSMLSTERADRAAHYISGGRVVVICDNTPFALVMPISLAVLLDSPDGNQQRWQNGTFTCCIRMLAFFFTTMLSGLYISIVCFHTELIPTQLLGLIAVSRNNIPFSSLVELICMEIMFELVREAGLRIPSAAGGAISVVGGLILGQASVEAQLVSPITLIIVAISGLANAALPDYDLAFGIRIIKFVFIIAGGTLGFLGIGAAFVFFQIVLSGQSSLSESMVLSAADGHADNNTVFYQKPLWKQEFRAKILRPGRLRQQPWISRAWDKKKG